MRAPGQAAHLFLGLQEVHITMLSLILVGLVLANVQASSACGVRQIDSGLNDGGGGAATHGHWPWQVSIRKSYLIEGGNYHTCGGTLINHRYVLTATQCFQNADAGDYEIVLGNYNVDTVDASQRSYYIETIINHADYDSTTMMNDITLLRLSSYVSYTNYIQPACLATQDWPARTDTWITGWGGQAVPVEDPRLQENTAPVIATSTCNQRTWYNGEVDPTTMFCAGYAEGGMGFCLGDGGGPVVVDKEGTFEVIGITSWGYGCVHARNPGVYTRVFNFLDWISDNTY